VSGADIRRDGGDVVPTPRGALMDTWLILLGVLLPLAPMLQMIDSRLDSDDRHPAPVTGDNERQTR
jgi:hypothetical protein